MNRGCLNEWKCRECGVTEDEARGAEGRGARGRKSMLEVSLGAGLKCMNQSKSWRVPLEAYEPLLKGASSSCMKMDETALHRTEILGCDGRTGTCREVGRKTINKPMI